MMRSKSWIACVPSLLVIAVVLGVTSFLKADIAHKTTILTFSAPVEVGGVVIGPGTYVFQLMGTNGARNIVGIWNKDQTKLISMVMGIPDYRMSPAGRTIIRFTESGKDSPQAIREWFYPGSEWGLEFVYPHSHALRIAKASGLNVLSMPEETKHTKTGLSNAKINRVTPTGKQIQTGGH
jgi:hypothetical protein